MNIPIIGTVIEKVTDAFQAKERRKAEAEQAKLKIQQANADAQNSLDLSDAEWEALSVNTLEHSWKDEYLTIVITAPLLMILVGGVVAAFTGDMRILEGVRLAVVELKTLDVDLGFLMEAVTLAGIGLKVWRMR